MVPIVTRVAEEYEGRALVGTVDTRAQGSLAAAYGVNLVPTFVFFKNGREVSRIVGAMTYEELAAQVQALVAAP
jgi:thioredoxin-like negative regulator of GroEL